MSLEVSTKRAKFRRSGRSHCRCGLSIAPEESCNLRARLVFFQIFHFAVKQKLIVDLNLTLGLKAQLLGGISDRSGPFRKTSLAVLLIFSTVDMLLPFAINVTSLTAHY